MLSLQVPLVLFSKRRKRNWWPISLLTWGISWSIGWLMYTNRLSWRSRLFIWLWLTLTNMFLSMRSPSMSTSWLELPVCGSPANTKKFILLECKTTFRWLTLVILSLSWRRWREKYCWLWDSIWTMQLLFRFWRRWVRSGFVRLMGNSLGMVKKVWVCVNISLSFLCSRVWGRTTVRRHWYWVRWCFPTLFWSWRRTSVYWTNRRYPNRFWCYVLNRCVCVFRTRRRRI